MDQVLKYSSMGYSQAEISKVLQISQPHVSRTISAITKKAREDVEHHIKETLPYQRKKALTLFENIKKKAIAIASKEKIGDRDRIAAIALIKDIEKEIWALYSQGEYVKRAINVSNTLENRLASLELEEEEEPEKEEDEEEQEQEEERQEELDDPQRKF